MSIVYTRTARADLREITRYYAQVNPDYGGRVIDQIRQQCQRLEQFPKMGRERDDLADGIRSFVVRPYVIFYREVRRGIAVVRVLHGRRDIGPGLFGS